MLQSYPGFGITNPCPSVTESDSDCLRFSFIAYSYCVSKGKQRDLWGKHENTERRRVQSERKRVENTLCQAENLRVPAHPQELVNSVPPGRTWGVVHQVSYWGEVPMLEHLLSLYPSLDLEAETSEDAAQTPRAYG
eukprot:g36678.t1